MKAIISDIHGNLEALQAVLADIARHDVEAIYCLGDVVGYGPNPRECIDLVAQCQVTLLGNHDQGVMFDPIGFHEIAERALFWTRDQLEVPTPDRPARDRRWEFLTNCLRRHQEGDCLYVHGSARNPLNEYVFPDDVCSPGKMRALFGLVEHCCFQGHTHVPGIFTESLEFLHSTEVGPAYPVDGDKILCNVGSVGQPRDADWRACYVLFDGEAIRYRRVEYDLETTIGKIYAVPQLNKFLGDRLRLGR